MYRVIYQLTTVHSILAEMIDVITPRAFRSAKQMINIIQMYKSNRVEGAFFVKIMVLKMTELLSTKISAVLWDTFHLQNKQ